MQYSRRVHAVLALTCVLAVGACKGATPPGPVRVYPRDGGTGKATVSVVSASMTENAVQLTREEIRVVLGVANTGSVPVTGVVVQEGRLEAAGLDLPLVLSPEPGADASPIAPGETRNFSFSASVVPLGVCTSDLEFKPNPHSGLVSIGLTVVSSAGGTALAGVDVPVTCQFGTGDVMLSCATTVADACDQTDMQGNLILHCSPNWNSALQDASLCGTGAADDHGFACSQFMYRVIVINGVERIYVYAGTGQQSLVAVLAPGTTGPTCLAGPQGGFTFPGCDAVLAPDAGPFTGASGACGPFMDAGMPQPDAGERPDVRSPPADAAAADAATDDAAPADAGVDAATTPDA